MGALGHWQAHVADRGITNKARSLRLHSKRSRFEYKYKSVNSECGNSASISFVNFSFNREAHSY